MLNPEIKLRFPIEIDLCAQETEVPVKSGTLVNRLEIICASQIPLGKKLGCKAVSAKALAFNKSNMIHEVTKLNAQICVIYDSSNRGDNGAQMCVSGAIKCISASLRCSSNHTVDIKAIKYAVILL